MRATAIAVRVGLAVCLVATGNVAHAEQSFPADPEHPIAFAPVPVRNWRVSAAMGYEYDSGVEGGTTEQFLPFALRFEYGAISLSLATSRVSIDGERIVGGFSIPGLSEDRLEAALERLNALFDSDIGPEDLADLSFDASGIGDTLVSLSYTWFDPDRWMPFVEFTTSVKIPTASDENLIGTGKYDWILQIDLAKPIGRFTPFASLAYRFNGSPMLLGPRSVEIARPEVIDLIGQSAIMLDRVRIPVKNSLQATLGSSLLLSDAVARVGGRNVGLYAGLLYDFAQSPFKGVDDAHELVTYLTFDLFGRLQVGPSFVVGLSPSAPDWGIATQVLVSY